MSDFSVGTIEVRYYTDGFGPYQFNFSEAIPSGVTLSSATVRAFVGTVKSSSDLSNFVEITSELIETNQTDVSSPNVNVYFKYPGSTYEGEKVTLVFELTLSNGGKHPYFFRYIYIRGQES